MRLKEDSEKYIQNLLNNFKRLIENSKLYNDNNDRELSDIPIQNLNKLTDDEKIKVYILIENGDIKIVETTSDTFYYITPQGIDRDKNNYYIKKDKENNKDKRQRNIRWIIEILIALSGWIAFFNEILCK